LIGIFATGQASEIGISETRWW